MTARAPYVSVVMTTFNGGAFLQETVRSILSQTYEDFEFIIVDDGSTDDTLAILGGFSDPRIQIFVNSENVGISEARNRALLRAQGKYVAATDQDDVSLPRRLAVEVKFLDEHPDVSLVATSAKELRNGKLRSLYPPEERSHVIAWRLYTRCSIVHSTICYRRKIARRGPILYRPEYAYAEDFVLFHEMAKAGRLVVLPRELVIYREHGRNASSRNGAKMDANGIRFLTEVYQRDLELEVGTDEVRRLWVMFNLGEPAETEEDLLAGAMLYQKGLDAFVRKQDLTPAQVRDLAEFASHEWWRAVRTFCISRRCTDARRVFDQITGLSMSPPSTLELCGVQLRCLMRKLRPWSAIVQGGRGIDVGQPMERSGGKKRG